MAFSVKAPLTCTYMGVGALNGDLLSCTAVRVRSCAKALRALQAGTRSHSLPMGIVLGVASRATSDGRMSVAHSSSLCVFSRELSSDTICAVPRPPHAPSAHGGVRSKHTGSATGGRIGDEHEGAPGGAARTRERGWCEVLLRLWRSGQAVRRCLGAYCPLVLHSYCTRAALVQRMHCANTVQVRTTKVLPSSYVLAPIQNQCSTSVVPFSCQCRTRALPVEYCCSTHY